MNFDRVKQIGKAYRRHIIVDNIQRTVSIEVLWDITGQLREQEFKELKQGMWWKYVPQTEIEQFRSIINGGYQVQIVWNSGAQNEQFYIIQIASISEEKPVLL